MGAGIPNGYNTIPYSQWLQAIIAGAKTLGNVFYVHSTDGTDATGYGSLPESPVASIDYANGLCTADNGDIIIVLPGHAETISAAAGIVFDTAGVTVAGMGTGTLKPKITFDTANTTDIDITAANVTLMNLVFECDFEDIAVMIDLDAKNCTFEDCEFLDKEADHNCVVYINCDDTANACDGLTVRRCTAISPDVANDHFIAAVGNIDRLTVEDCYINIGVNNGEAIIEASTGKDFTNCKILRNTFLRNNTENVVAMESDTADNSGVIAFNLCGHADTDSATPYDVSGARLFENYAVGVDDKNGLLLPEADDDA
jgi:hypothetical protein